MSGKTDYVLPTMTYQLPPISYELRSPRSVEDSRSEARRSSEWDQLSPFTFQLTFYVLPTTFYQLRAISYELPPIN